MEVFIATPFQFILESEQNFRNEELIDYNDDKYQKKHAPSAEFQYVTLPFIDQLSFWPISMTN